MKIRKIIIAALCLAGFILGACANADDADNQGVIVINFDNAGARAAAAATGYTVDTTGMTYTIKLTSSGKSTINEKTSKDAISIRVSEGTWYIEVDAKGDRVIGCQKEKNGVEVQVTAGKSARADINMKVTGTRVSNWAELKADFNELNEAEGKLKDLDNIEIIGTELVTSEIEIDNAPTLKIDKNITLWSKENVTIIRKIDTRATVFNVNKGTLILESRNGGTINIDGNKGSVKCSRALINVYENGTLIMHEGVTLTNNHTDHFGGGVYVEGGKFFMDGGTISGNTAGENGGGVFIEDGKFFMDGGTISGNTAERNGGGVYVRSTANKGRGEFKKTGDSNIFGFESSLDEKKKNKAGPNGGNGDAVYDNGTPYNITLGDKEPWPR